MVIDDSVLLGFSDGSLVSLDRVGGDVQWDRRVGEGRYPDLVAAPVHHGTDVFVSGYFKPLVAIDVATRNVRWRLEYGAANASLVVESEPLTVIHHPGTDGKLRTVAAITGAELWEWDSGTAGALTTPVLTEAGLLVGSSDGGLYLIDPTAGELVWEYSEDRLLDGVTAAPVVEGRQVLFVTNAGRIHSMLVPVPPGEDDFDESPTASRTRRPL